MEIVVTIALALFVLVMASAALAPFVAEPAPPSTRRRTPAPTAGREPAGDVPDGRLAA